MDRQELKKEREKERENEKKKNRSNTFFIVLSFVIGVFALIFCPEKIDRELFASIITVILYGIFYKFFMHT